MTLFSPYNASSSQLLAAPIRDVVYSFSVRSTLSLSDKMPLTVLCWAGSCHRDDDEPKSIANGYTNAVQS